MSVEPAASLCDALADPAQPEYPHGRLKQIDAVGVHPLSSLRRPITFGDVASDGEHQSQRHVGHGLRVCAREIRNNYPAPRAFGDVHLVDAGAVSRHHLESVRLGEGRRGEVIHSGGAAVDALQ